MLAPITHRSPPSGYGPWEQVVSDLSEGLTHGGHDVWLFAPAGTQTSARLVETVPHPLAEWPTTESPDHRVWEEIHVAAFGESISEGGFDIAHSHLGIHSLFLAGILDTPLVTTLHGSAWNKSIHPALRRYKSQPFVSLSDSERTFFPDLNWVATVHNGIDCARFEFSEVKGDFLLFAGRMAPEKQPHVAIEVARRTGMPMKLAGPIEERHREYFSAEVMPRLDGRAVEYMGDLPRSELVRLYPAAAALVMPLAWEEPFGLVVVESLASGTPVIAWRRGAMPELIRHGVTGAIVEDVDGAVAAIGSLDDFDRRACRRDAESRFDIAVMARRYISVYREVLEMAQDQRSASSSSSTTTVISRTR